MKNSQYDWTIIEYDQLNGEISNSEVTESNIVKIQKPRMMHIDDDSHSTNYDTVFNT